MRLRNVYDYIIYENEDLTKLQEYLQSETKYILDDMFNYTDFFTNDNLKVVATDPSSMTVTVTSGVGYIEKDLAYLLTNTDQPINPPNETERTDIISVTVTEVDNDTQTKTFVDPNTLVPYTDNVSMQHYRKYIIHYHPNTTEVPEGEVGLAKITVGVGVSQILTTDILDIRPQKPSQDLTSHRTMTPIDHPDGSITDAKINSQADIGLSKLSGHSVDTLLELLYLEELLPMQISFTYEGDKLTGYTAIGDKSHNATLTYDANDSIVSVEKNNGTIKRTWTFTYGGEGNVATAEMEDTPV